MHKNLKRLFFGFDVIAPWPETYPKGRLILEQHRHLTLSFLGNVELEKIQNTLSQLPKPTHLVGLTGQFDECLFFPERHPHVVAWHLQWWDKTPHIENFQRSLTEYLRNQGFSFKDNKRFHPHVTLCRDPFRQDDWKKTFSPLPFFIKDFHLYESLGNSTYKHLWSHSILSLFDELDHTADIAFHIRGETLHQLFHNAQTALAFKFPSILPYFSTTNVQSLDDIVIALNDIVRQIDQKEGCPFKAVSFHGDLIKKNKVLNWEMIIDV